MNPVLGFVTPQRRSRGAAWSVLLAAAGAGALTALLIQLTAAQAQSDESVNATAPTSSLDESAPSGTRSSEAARYWSQVGQALR
jgi:hypothetical protein